MKKLAALVALGLASAAGVAAPVAILFVGNSYTFGRVDPVTIESAGIACAACSMPAIMPP